MRDAKPLRFDAHARALPEEDIESEISRWMSAYGSADPSGPWTPWTDSTAPNSGDIKDHSRRYLRSKDSPAIATQVIPGEQQAPLWVVIALLPAQVSLVDEPQLLAVSYVHGVNAVPSALADFDETREPRRPVRGQPPRHQATAACARGSLSGFFRATLLTGTDRIEHLVAVLSRLSSSVKSGITFPCYCGTRSSKIHSRRIDRIECRDDAPRHCGYELARFIGDFEPEVRS
jgi:hypothetical protein